MLKQVQHDGQLVQSTKMQLSDFLLIVTVPAIIAAILAGIIGWFRPAWGLRATVATAALPFPALIWTLCLFIYIRASNAPAEKCGVDACGMAMAFSMIIAGYSVITFALGAFLATIVKLWVSRR